MESKCAEEKTALILSCAFFIQRRNGSITKITKVIFTFGTGLFSKPWRLSKCISFFLEQQETNGGTGSLGHQQVAIAVRGKVMAFACPSVGHGLI